MKYGFYNDLDEIKQDVPDATFGFLEVALNMGRFNAFDFLHGFCLDFALKLSEMYGYIIETVRNEKDELIHAYCIANIKGKDVYIDIRGITTDKKLFYEEYEDDVDYIDGSLWTFSGEAKINRYSCPEDYLKTHSDLEWFSKEAGWFIEENRDYYDISDDMVEYLVENELKREQKDQCDLLENIIQKAAIEHSSKSMNIEYSQRFNETEKEREIAALCVPDIYL